MQSHQLKIGSTVYLRLKYCPDTRHPDDTAGVVIAIERRNYNLYKYAKIQWENGKVQWRAVSQLRFTPPSYGTYHVKIKTRD